MSEIAFNINGEPFDPAPGQAAWRVRKLKAKGAPEVVYGRDGLPLFLPMDADIEDLRREAPTPGEGKYRLDPIDDHSRPILNAQASYVCLHPVVPERMPAPPARTSPAAEGQAEANTRLVDALLESQRQHTELVRMYVGQFPAIVNALSAVVRSAGDAGLPARVPLVVPVAPEVKHPEPSGGDKEDEDEDQEDDENEEDEEEDDDQDAEVIEAASGSEWNWPRFATAALDKFSPAIDVLVGQLPTLGAVLGARRAKRPATEPTPPTTAAPATDIAAHLNAIRAALSPEEAIAAMALVDELPMADKLAYAQNIRGMSVPEAVTYIRAELAKRARNSAHGAAAAEADEQAGPGIEMSDAEFDAHVAAICAAMTPDESETVRVMFEELVDEHRLIWAEKLCRMSVPEGVAFLRTQLAEALRSAHARGAVDPRIVRTPSAAPSSAARSAAPVRDPAPHPSARVKSRRDGRRAAGSATPTESPLATSTAPTGGAPSPELDMVPTSQAHIDAIQRVLTPEENAFVRAYLATLPLPERSAWIEVLLALPVAEAVVAIRAQRIADRASGAAADDSIVAATAQPSKDATTAAEAAAVSTAEIASIGAEKTPPSRSPMPTSTTPAASGNVVTPPDEQPEPTLAIAAPADAVPTASAAASPTAEAPSLDAPPSETIATNADAHLMAIELALTAGERLLVHTTVAQMDPEAGELLLDRLLSASVPEGAAILRAAIQDRTIEAPPAETRSQGAALAGASGPDERQRLGDGETFDTAEEVETEELGDARELEIEELDEEEQPDDGQPDNEPATDGQALANAETTTAALTAVPSAGLPTLDPEAYRHFMAINAALTFAERMRVFELGARLSPAELRAWIAALTPLSVPEAVAKVRGALAMTDASAANGNAQAARKGGVS